jgi:hypothetical protein
LLLILCEAPVFGQGAKPPREAVVVVQLPDPDHSTSNERFRAGALALKDSLIKGNMDAEVYRLGKGPADNDPAEDVKSLDKLQEFLLGKNKNVCWHSLHFMGHGDPNGALIFPPADNSSKPVLVSPDIPNPEANADAKVVQFGFKKFNQLLHSVVCDDGLVSLNSCWSARTAQDAANATGLKITGFTGMVESGEDTCPRPVDGSKEQEFTPQTPDATYEDSVELSLIPPTDKKKPGRRYYWKVGLAPVSWRGEILG